MIALSEKHRFINWHIVTLSSKIPGRGVCPECMGTLDGDTHTIAHDDSLSFPYEWIMHISLYLSS